MFSWHGLIYFSKNAPHTSHACLLSYNCIFASRAKQVEPGITCKFGLISCHIRLKVVKEGVPLVLNVPLGEDVRFFFSFVMLCCIVPFIFGSDISSVLL